MGNKGGVEGLWFLRGGGRIKGRGKVHKVYKGDEARADTEKG